MQHSFLDAGGFPRHLDADIAAYVARFENSRVRGATLHFYQLKGRTELLRWGDFDIGVAHEVETFAGNTWVARKGNDTLKEWTITDDNDAPNTYKL